MTIERKEAGPEIEEKDLDKVEGGVLIGLLLPAVQKVREAAARTDGGGSTGGSVIGGGPVVKPFDGRTGA